jgi:hypothetical protein
MPRHDCLWNSFILGSLSQITPNTSNSEDNTTSIAEQSDYDLLFDGPTVDLEGWQADKIINTTIPDDPDKIPSAGKIAASSSEIPEVRYLGGSDTDKSEKGEEIPTPPSESLQKKSVKAKLFLLLKASPKINANTCNEKLKS